jgi:hypothetical protein
VLDCPCLAIENIGPHGSAPLVIARDAVLLAEAVGGTKINLKDRVTAIGEPHGPGIVAPFIASLGASVDEDDHGESFFLLRVDGE